MRRAIELAAGRRTHPNPAVGAVVLDTAGKIVGEGAHDGPGTPHAEVVALSIAGDSARGGTIVVTLEPCAHQGRTPPCTDAIIEAGIATVVAATGDPDPQVAGRGFERLEASGIAVSRGLLAAEAEQVDAGYFHHRRTGRPFLTLKAALTLDGQQSAVDGTSQWITGEDARADVHRLRSRVDGVMVGAGTVRVDDPKLTVRLEGFDGPQPRPIILGGAESLPAHAAVLGSNPLIYATRPIDIPGEVVIVPAGPGGVDVMAVAKDLGERGFVDVLVEGGSRVAASLLEADLVSRVVFYYGAKLASGQGRSAVAGVWNTLESAVSLRIDSTVLVGCDVRIDASVVR